MRRLLLPLALFALTVVAVLPRWLGARAPSRAKSGPVAVRYPEGTVHGFLDLRSVQDRLLASGDLLQVPRDNGVESRLVFKFRDQSRFDETTTFTQQGVFRMQSYHLVQQGPAFAADLDAVLYADGRYRVCSLRRPAVRRADLAPHAIHTCLALGREDRWALGSQGDLDAYHCNSPRCGDRLSDTSAGSSPLATIPAVECLPALDVRRGDSAPDSRHSGVAVDAE